MEKIDMDIAMTISQVIAALQKVMDKHGDLPVGYQDMEGWLCPEGVPLTVVGHDDKCVILS